MILWKISMNKHVFFYEVTLKYKFKNLLLRWKTQTKPNLNQVYVVWN